jgi:large conductance mechanosensitive channel
MDFKHIDPAKQALSLFDEFKAFAFKGNVIDLAVGVIVGAAFGNIVKSLVDHIIMPSLGVVLPGKEGYTGWKLTIDGKPIPYGLFLGDVVNFLIVAATLFVFIVKFLGWLTKLRGEVPATPPLTKDQALLTEIRDLLKAQCAAHGDGGERNEPRPTEP